MKELPNSSRISLLDGMWFIYNDEINTIKEVLSKYKGIKFGGEMQFGKGKISDMKNSAPKIWNYLNQKLAEIGIDNTSSKPQELKPKDTQITKKETKTACEGGLNI